MEKAIRFRERYEAERQQCREALGRPKCSFGIEYQAGFATDLSRIDVARICARLEAFAAAESLALAVASGRQPPSYQVSPLWGGEYEVAVGDGLVTVRGILPKQGGMAPTAEVPNLAPPRQPQ